MNNRITITVSNIYDKKYKYDSDRKKITISSKPKVNKQPKKLNKELKRQNFEI